VYNPLIQAAHKHLGRPWNANGFDCWECVRAIYSDAFGIILPTVPLGEGADVVRYRDAITEHTTGKAFVEIAKPVDGCIVAMGKREWPHHVGVYIKADAGRIVHCLEHAGCTIDYVAMLRGNGWGYMRFYQVAGVP
jgi:cell wall-associated NlpC family hydrolase